MFLFWIFLCAQYLLATHTFQPNTMLLHMLWERAYMYLNICPNFLVREELTRQDLYGDSPWHYTINRTFCERIKFSIFTAHEVGFQQISCDINQWFKLNRQNMLFWIIVWLQFYGKTESLIHDPCASLLWARTIGDMLKPRFGKDNNKQPFFLCTTHLFACYIEKCLGWAA